MDYAEVKKVWETRGFSCWIWTDQPGQVWANFIHNTDELIMLIEGEMELSFADQRLRLAPGQEVLVPAGVPHTVINNGSQTSRWYYGYKKAAEAK